MDFRTLKFAKEVDTDFIRTLRKRVRHHFKSNGISRHGNLAMKVKTVCMIGIYMIPYLLMLTGVINSVWGIVGMWLIMGVGKAGIGLSIMHDANHGAYSANRTVNKYMGYMLNFVGGSSHNWKIRHNVLHHSFTNVDGVDEDIDPRGVLRFSPHQELRSIHRFQHIYAWFLYGLMTITWIAGTDFKRFFKYRGMDVGEEKDVPQRKILFRMVITKIFYFTYMLVLPILLLPVSWWMVFICFFLMHYLAGLILGLVFQPAHVVPQNEYPLPDEEGQLENNWAIHQMLTTTNFAPTNRLFSWYVGGLNYQIEHHLFPTICHVHYRALSKIVRETAEEFNVPYHSEPTFWSAIVNHGRMLWQLGRA